jgi:hypothetical protein
MEIIGMQEDILSSSNADPSSARSGFAARNAWPEKNDNSRNRTFLTQDSSKQTLSTQKKLWDASQTIYALIHGRGASPRFFHLDIVANRGN